MGFFTYVLLIFSISAYAGEGKQMTPEEIKETKQKMAEVNKKISEKVGQALEGSMTPALYEKYKTKPIIKPNLVGPAKSRVYGNKTARNNIVVFSDFACGHCKTAAKDLKARINENKKEVNLTYILFPLDNRCNPYMKGKLSDYSCPSIKLALCAEKQGKIWKAMDFLYENQELGNKSPFDLNSFVKKMEKKLVLKGLQECLNSPWLEQRLKQEQEVYKDLKIPGTPFVLLNNKQIGTVYKFQQPFKDFLKYLNLKEDPERK
ncbi:MAG: thioredoxin domain-containing protein [bacterium]